MNVEQLDHLVLTVKNIEATCDFYHRVLGMDIVTFGSGRKALSFGVQKINLHQWGHELEPKAHCPMPGSADLCFIVNQPMNIVTHHLNTCGIDIIDGPVARTGARGTMQSVYFRDVDHNLIEVAVYPESVSNPNQSRA